MLQVQDVSVEVGGRFVVDHATFTVMPRDKVGLVGRNGAGKTSLFKVLGGAVDPTQGKINRKGGFGYLPQDPRIEPALEHRSAISHVLSGRGIDETLERIEKLRIAMEEDANERNVARYSREQDLFASSGGYAAESEARSIANGLGLKADRLDLPISVLSGGERRRVELSRILFAGSDALLLDEPTNHLDIDAKEWLLAFMRAYRGALLVISHDLDLLDEAITRVLHLDRPAEDAVGHLVEYKGTYSQYRTSRALDEERLTRKAALQTKEIARLQTVVDRFGAKATKAAMAHSKEKQIARLESQRVYAAAGDRTLKVRFPDPPTSGVTVIQASGLSKAYGGPAVFEDVSFDLGRGERLLVLGLNGAGKTSLLRILAGETTANLGQFEFGHQVNMGYYAQEHDNLLVHENLLANIRAAVPPGERNVVRRREDQARPSDADGGSQQPAAPRRTHQQPRPAQQAIGRRCAHRVEGCDHLRESRHRVRRTAATHQGAADARRSGRLLQQGLARTRRSRVSLFMLVRHVRPSHSCQSCIRHCGVDDRRAAPGRCTRC
jgi:ATPase subunit of ABC transporter with duplicated ATPase domains